MAFLKFKADKLFDGFHFLDDDRILITREDGTIESIIPIADAGDDIQKMEGIITPGFINCHCHLELSHLKNVIPPHTGLTNFLCSVVTKRDFSPEIIQQEIINAEDEMYHNGTVAVGDIGNTADTADVKSKSKIRWHNFVEVLNFTDDNAERRFNHYQSVAAELENALQHSDIPHQTSIVPHSSYSISPKTFKLINEATKNKTISIHNQEHPAEDELYKTGGGDLLKFFKIFGLENSPFPVTGVSSIRSVLPHFNNGQTIFLIHNVFMSEEDILWANDYAANNNLSLVYCICFNANLYIQNQRPPLDLFIKHNCHIVLGTDSYSSNWQLSIGKEVQMIHLYYPHIPLELILQWAIGNGAKALGWQNEIGTFEKNKKPGVLLYEPVFGLSRRIV